VKHTNRPSISYSRKDNKELDRHWPEENIYLFLDWREQLFWCQDKVNNDSGGGYSNRL